MRRVVTLGLSMFLLTAVAHAQDLPISGTAVPAMMGFDRLMSGLLARWTIPGGSVAVAKDGRLVFARGYGRADVEAGRTVQPDALFRIASLSKPITAVAVLRLVEEGKLDPDAKAFGLLQHLKPPEGATTDPRITDITVRHLLTHSAGWNRDRSGDPMFPPLSTQAAQTLKAPEPASCETIIRFVLGRPLDFSPGTAYTYSNFGYCVLGRIVEKVTAQSYEDYVKRTILGPVGISRMRLGRTLLEARAPEEVRYYMSPGASSASSVFPGAAGPVPRPYGAFSLEAMDAHGGWIASAVDLMRFVTAADGRRSPGILRKPETLRLMTARPYGLWGGAPAYYAMGWMIRPTETDANWWHSGSLPGSAAHLVRAANGWSWAALFNSRPENEDGFLNALDSGLWQAAREVAQWPTHDLSGQFP